jgi:hypothetical protein
MYELLVVHDGGIHTVATSKDFSPTFVASSDFDFSETQYETAKAIAKDRARTGRWAFVVTVGDETGPVISRSYRSLEVDGINKS